MSYLIDTNVISELVRSKPNKKVITWFEKVPIETAFLSVLTLGEIRKGIEKIQDVKRKNKLLIWLERDLISHFNNRILEVTIEVADRWGRLLSQSPRKLPAIDSLIVATALHHDVKLVTRNVGNFSGCPGLELINPWEV